MTIPALSRNESYARAAVAAFAAQLDPTIEELNDIKAAVSEAVTNCIVHAYADTFGKIDITCRMYDNGIYIKIRDKGCGIEDIKQAMTPLFTTSPETERAGLGFAVMESFTDRLKVSSKPGKGTTVIMEKNISKKALS
ncbi:MAG: anti-sigma F factor [Eubacterium sp.]|nr:anti-sigma F factor [Eubacterium sp.]